MKRLAPVLLSLSVLSLGGPVVGSASASSTTAKESAIRRCVNVERGKRGIAPLRRSVALDQAARLHARQMRTRRFFDHVDLAGRSPADRVSLFTDAFGEGVGENIAGGNATAKATCRQWMNSPGHRRNFLDPDYAYLGAGYAAGGRYRHYWVQTFALDPQD